MTEAGRITAIIDGDISALTSKLAQAKSQATAAASGVEGDFKSKIGAGISGALSSGDYSKAGKQIGGAVVDGITAGFGPLGGAVGEVTTALGPTGIVATAAIAGAAIIASSASSAAMEWESGMSKISKTTGIEKGTSGFSDLNNDLKDLYATMPTTVTEIQNVASSAGSLGIAQQSIAGFTQTALQMGSAFDIPAEQAAVSVGKIKSQLKSYSDEVMGASGAVDDSKFAQHFGSAVDFAGNELNATESEVLDFSTRTAGAFSNLGGNMYELAGWGGELASVFSSSELGAGSFNAALNQLMGTTKGSENARAKAGELLGVTPEEFQALMTNDPTDTLLDIGKAMEGLSATEKFQAAGILGGGYGDDFFQKMVGKTDEWRAKIEEVKQAGESGTSIGGSYEAGVENIKAQLEILRNSAGAIFQDIGGPLNSAFAPVITAVAGGLNKVRAIGENLWGPFTTAISPATTAVSILASGVGTLAGMQLDGLVYASEAVNTGFEVGSAFVGAFGEELSSLVTGTSTFQTLSSSAQGFYTTLSGIGTGISDIVGKITSGLGEAIPTALSGAGQAVGSLLDQAGLGGISGTAGEVNSFLGAVYDNAAEKLGWGVKEGTEKGIKEGSDAAKGQVESDLTDATKSAFATAMEELDKAYSELTKKGVSKDIASAQVYGGAVSDEAALAMVNAANQQQKANKILSSIKTSFPGLDAYIQNTWLQYHGTRSDTYTGFYDTSGNSISDTFAGFTEEERDAAYQAFVEGIQPGILDSAKYFESHAGDFKDVVSSIWADGAISGTEKVTAEEFARSLEALKIKYPVEFEEADLQGTLDDLQTLADGKPIKLRVDLDAVEVDFEVWLQEHGDLFLAQWQNTKVMPLREQQRQRQQWELEAEKSNPNALKYLQLIDKAITSDEPGMVSGLYVYTAALLNAAPEIANTAWLTQELGSAQAEFSDHIVYVDGRFVALGEDGKALGETYLDTTIAAKGANGGLIRLQTETIATADAMASAARAAGSLDSVFGNYALSLRSNASQSAQYDYLGSGGRTSWSNVFGNYTSQFTLPTYAEGGIVDQPTAIFGEAGREAFVPISDRAAGLRILPQVMRELGIPGYAKGSAGSSLRPPAGSDLNNFGKQNYLSDGAVAVLTDNLGSCAGASELNADSVAKNTVVGENWLDCTTINSNSLESNTAAINQLPSAISTSLSNVAISKTVSIDSSPAGALVTGLSKNGYVVTYDPRTDTCDGLPFNAPDPSLKTTDPFYLGLTQNSPAYKSVEEDGWGGVVAQALTPELAAMQEQYQQQIQESQRTAQATQQTATNTANMVSGISSLGSAVSGALVSSGSGYASNGYTYTTDYGSWGGTSISGGGSWVGAGYDREPSWGGEVASYMASSNGGYSSGSFSAGNGGYQLPAIFRARGGLIDKGPELTIVGEAGTEMILPPHVTQAVLDMTAKGGGAAPNITVNYAPVINGAGLSAEELTVVLEKDRAALIEQIAEGAKGF